MANAQLQAQNAQLQAQLAATAGQLAVANKAIASSNVPALSVKRPSNHVSFNTCDQSIHYNPSSAVANGFGGYVGDATYHSAISAGSTPFGPKTHAGYRVAAVDYGSSLNSMCLNFGSANSLEEDIEEEVGDLFYSLVNSASYHQEVSDAILPIFQALQLDPRKLSSMYPRDLQWRIWSIIPPSMKPVKASSVAALVLIANQVVRKQSDQGNKMLSELCDLVHQVTLQFGGARVVAPHDLSGCKRFDRSDKIHLCPGSHCTLSCPQARWSRSAPHPSFGPVYEMLEHDRLMAQCNLYPKEDHDPSKCGAQQRLYSSCRPCRTYFQNSVYPCMYGVMIQLLKDPHTSEDDKHTYRVQLASGLLSASWVRYPPKDFLAEADRHTFP